MCRRYLATVKGGALLAVAAATGDGWITATALYSLLRYLSSVWEHDHD
jgi:hypothetical protein